MSPWVRVCTSSRWSVSHLCRELHAISLLLRVSITKNRPIVPVWPKFFRNPGSLFVEPIRAILCRGLFSAYACVCVHYTIDLSFSLSLSILIFPSLSLSLSLTHSLGGVIAFTNVPLNLCLKGLLSYLHPLHVCRHSAVLLGL